MSQSSLGADWFSEFICIQRLCLSFVGVPWENLQKGCCTSVMWKIVIKCQEQIITLLRCSHTLHVSSALTPLSLHLSVWSWWSWRCAFEVYCPTLASVFIYFLDFRVLALGIIALFDISILLFARTPPSQTRALLLHLTLVLKWIEFQCKILKLLTTKSFRNHIFVLCLLFLDKTLLHYSSSFT